MSGYCAINYKTNFQGFNLKHVYLTLLQEERAKSTGKNWYNMKAPEITEEMKNDLEILKMRSTLDPKHFYKKNDFKNLPKYFQVGVESFVPRVLFYISHLKVSKGFFFFCRLVVLLSLPPTSTIAEFLRRIARGL